MSLNEDLARNRAIFEKLVGGMEYKTDNESISAEGRKLSANFPAESGNFKPLSAIPVSDIPSTVFPTSNLQAPASNVPASAFTVPSVPVAERKPAEIESYSLARGTVRRTSMSLTPPEAIKAPPLTETAAAPSADPLEELYHQLEVEARRSSQLSGEEGFFE